MRPCKGYIVVWETPGGRLFVCTDVFRSVDERDAYIRTVRARPRPPELHSIHEIAL